MVHHNRYYPLRKATDSVADDDESQPLVGFTLCGNAGYGKRTRPKLLYFFCLSFVSCALILAPQLFTSRTTFSRLYSIGVEDDGPASGLGLSATLISSVPNGTIRCDRSGFRSDVCVMKGDVRTHSPSSSIFVYSSATIDHVEEELQHEKIKPYTRKWETSVMATIDELNLISKKQNLGIHLQCDVIHKVPAVFFSTGGYTGNVYHEFNDGIIPLYITSQRFNKKVVFVILEYHNWWITKYDNILSHLSDYPAIDFGSDKRVHCFPEAIAGLKIHDELTVDPSLMEGHRSIKDFRNILDLAYWPRIRGLIQDEEREEALMKKEEPSSSPSSENSLELVKGKQESKRPKLVILSRNGSRAISNEASIVRMAEAIGFTVQVLRPDKTTELARVFRALNSSDVMVGVHGAAMTHFLFMKPGCVFIQVIPLGTEWAAQTYYGEPAMKLGLKYIGYKIVVKESSLYDDYDNKDDPVLRDPNSVNEKGWEFTKKIYLDKQTVRLNLVRFRKRLLRAYYYSVAKKNGHLRQQSQ